MPMVTSFYLNILIGVGMTTYWIKNQLLAIFLSLMRDQFHTLVAKSLLSPYQAVKKNILLKLKLHIQHFRFVFC